MSLPSVIVIGAGGHARVVADALLAAGRTVLGFTDRDARLHGSQLLGLPVLGDDSALALHSREAVELALGLGTVGANQDTLGRRLVQQTLQGQGWRMVSVRHPSAIVSAFAQVQPGAQLLANCVVQAGAVIGEGCIVNTAAVIEHDTEVGAFSHVAPRALLCGSVIIGSCSHIGAAAVVRQGLRLGEQTVVAAGAVVVHNCKGHTLLVGVPAKPREVQS
jgi:sugar O-acyltransferase (sialic acid O-acetyltransferase NeuD family)